MANAEPTAERAWRMRAARGRLPWGTALLVVGFLVAVGLLSMFPFVDQAGDESRFADTIDWLGRLKDFTADVYQSGDFQMLIAMLAIGLALERIIPACRPAESSTLFNIPYSAMMLLFSGAIAPLQVFVSETLVGWVGWRNIFDLRIAAKDSIALSFAAMLLGALIIDFFFYWFHRLQHTSKLLWQVHLLHHTDTALSVATTQRVHFLEHVVSPVFITAPIMILFNLSDDVIVLVAILPAVWSYCVHMNIRIGFGRFWWLISSPQYHRIHHSIELQHRNRNFAVWFPIWDILFGSAFAPRPGEYPETGVDGVEVSRLPEAFALPFVGWRRMAVSAFGRNGATEPAHQRTTQR
jgi:sterol desaturase/sphingolipid hydroxylase (fatty acid hydroxylase superfamily)